MRWTVSDVRRMIDSGAFANPETFELAEGLIEGRRDGTCRVLTGYAEVVAGVPLPLTDASEPEPDVTADSSLRTDQTVKAAFHARHGIPEYVIPDVANRRVEIRRHPEGEDWRETLILSESGEFTPLGASGPVRVSDLPPDR